MKISELKTKIKLDFTNRQKNIICAVVASPLIAILLVAGVCKAYDTVMYSLMENALKNAVYAAQGAHENAIKADKACESQYDLVVRYKQENKIALNGTGSPCPLN